MKLRPATRGSPIPAPVKASPDVSGGGGWFGGLGGFGRLDELLELDGRLGRVCDPEGVGVRAKVLTTDTVALPPTVIGVAVLDPL